ncbi:AAA family ATPase [Methanosarcina sp. UBA411]|jgi:AAA15 family ATPase/GTPase|uniref:AAA family ATPase n=1 Tax=Methanosarcina sp. UBA411 TaxID=1915589 RepID=UPI0025D74691|nr:AAA family ATPase [Methanosarcina sp. UBA411]
MKAIRLERFKGYEDSGWIKLDRPITLIFGNNSSGKSALLSSIMMLKQSLESIDREVPFIFSSKDGIDIGSFEDAVFNHEVDSKKPMIFSFEIEVENDYPLLNLSKQNSLIYSVKVVYNKKRHFNTIIGFDLVKKEDNKTIIKMSKKSNSFNAKPHFETEYAFDPSNLQLKWFFFTPLLFSKKEQSKTIQNSSDEAETTNNNDIYTEVYEITREFTIKILSFFDQLIHIGPIRHAPQRDYHFTGETPFNVGIDGRDAPQILFLDKYSSKSKKLINNVNVSLENLGYSLNWSILKGGVATLNLREINSNVDCNLKDVGFGISQLLPLLVQGYALNKAQYLLLEQPEIHLHPRAQSKLGDFFIEMSKKNKFFIIETHSEHILLRIRRRIAEGEINSEQVRICFVERKEGKSIINNIELDKFGQFVEIPDSFKSFFADDFEEVLKITEEIAKRKSKGE